MENMAPTATSLVFARETYTPYSVSDQQNEEDEASVHATEDSEDASGEYVLCVYGCVFACVCMYVCVCVCVCVRVCVRVCVVV